MGRGVAAIVMACVIWGSTGVFFERLAHVPPLEVFAHRTLWSVIIFGALLGFKGQARAPVRAVLRRGNRRVVAAASLFLAINWLVFVIAVQAGKALEASLGYFLFPLVAVLLGRIALGERLGRWPGVAVALAGAAVLLLALGLGVTPWVALGLGLSFGLYGLVKRGLALPPMVSVTAEALLVLPPSLALLIWLGAMGTGHFSQDTGTALLLVLSGPITAVPLILFTYAAQRIPMVALGLLSYLNPSLQFLAATLILHEPFGPWHAVAFAMIWTALAIYSVALWRARGSAARAAHSVATSGTVPK